LCTRLSRVFRPSTMAYRNGPPLWMILPHIGRDIIRQRRACQFDPC
jgi:hypothetical protein